LKIFLIIIILTFICGIWYNFDMIWLRFKWMHWYFSVTCKELSLPSFLEKLYFPRKYLCVVQEDGTRPTLFSTEHWRGGTLTALQRWYRQERRMRQDLPTRYTRRSGWTRLVVSRQRADRKREREREYHRHFVPFAIVSSLPNAAPATGEVHRKFYYSILIITLTRGARYRQTDT